MRRMLMALGIVMAEQVAAETVFEDFSRDAAARWDYVADRVMGGVSTGQAQIAGQGPDAVMRLQGSVSTENNGGFIQVRRRFADAWPKDASGLVLSVKGNGARYYVFLRTPNLARVWYSYRAPFVADADWQMIELPFDQFSPSHAGMPRTFAPQEVRSLGIVAYGEDYDADVSIRDIRIK